MTAHRSNWAWKRNRRGNPLEVEEHYADQSAVVREAVEEQEAQVAEAIAEEPSDFEPETPFGPEQGEYLESLSDSEATQALEAMDRDELLSLSDLLYSIGEYRTPEQERLYNLIQDILLEEGYFLPDDPLAE
jgi:hypothetical protein